MNTSKSTSSYISEVTGSILESSEVKKIVKAQLNAMGNAPSALSGASHAVRLSEKARGLGVSSDITIIPGETVVIDTSIDIKTLTINGTLACDNSLTQNVTLKAETIYVNGLFECGASSSERFNNKIAIILKDNNIANSSRRGLLINDGGTLKLHGSDAKSKWFRLNADAIKQTREIKIPESVLGQWSAGDTIAIGPSSYNIEDTETATIQSLSADGKTVVLSNLLQNFHLGTLQTFNGKNGQVILDERSEVGVLNRNIKIMPDESMGAITDQNGIGAHVMINNGGNAYVDSVEFYHLGQAGIMGRYPFHWHNGGDVFGQYVRNSSIHDTFQRCITIHSTQRALLE